jgi:hypothetical protein
MNENSTTAARALSIAERRYCDFDAAADRVEIRRRAGESHLQVKVNGRVFEAARVTSAFPLSARLQRVAFFDPQGEEIGCLKNTAKLDASSLRLLRDELDKAYFMPKIEAIMEINDYLDIEYWRVRTNRGERSFEVRQPRRNIRSLGPHKMVIRDVDGNRYVIRDWRQLERKSLSLLMRHL